MSRSHAANRILDVDELSSKQMSNLQVTISDGTLPPIVVDSSEFRIGLPLVVNVSIAPSCQERRDDQQSLSTGTAVAILVNQVMVKIFFVPGVSCASLLECC